MHRLLKIGVTGLMLAATAQSVAAEPPRFASPWASEAHTRARLIAGGKAIDAPTGALAAGVEIELAAGWKTYWRNPGSSGVPPLFDWSSSSNLASAEVRYPAPRRMADREGDIIGYQDGMILPVVLQPADPARDVTLVLELEYGVCKDICVPVQKRLEVVIPPAAGKTKVADALARAFERVPRPPNARRPADPKLAGASVKLDGEHPAIRINALFPGGADDADVFVEAPNGIWIPMAERDGPATGETAAFVVDLTDGADITELRGKTIRLTLVSPRGQSETTLKLE